MRGHTHRSKKSLLHGLRTQSQFGAAYFRDVFLDKSCNMKISELAQHEKILLLGYGREGKATENFLKSTCPHLQLEIADESSDPQAFNRQSAFALAIKSPGVPKRKVQIPYTTATNIFFANLEHYFPNAKTIGVTGSKGKSTTSSLIAHIIAHSQLPVCLAGNIGRPMLGELLLPHAYNTTFVLELSSYMLEDIYSAPDIAVFLNIFPEHLDYHQGLEPYITAKMRIQAHAKPNNFLVYDPSQPLLCELAQRTAAKTIPWRAEQPLSLSETKLSGEHNLRNIKAAFAATSLLGIPDQAILEAVRTFSPLPHRLQYVATVSGIKFFDDAIASAPEPTIEALKTLGNVDTLFLGGSDRGVDFTTLVDAIAQSPIRNLVFFPESGQRIRNRLQERYPTKSYNELFTDNMTNAVEFAFGHTAPDSICLLSTASPSYSLWKDFEAKGEAYQQCIFKKAHPEKVAT